MIDLSQKLPLARSLNRIAEQQAHNAISILGKALPAQVTAVAGSIVTVKFLIQSSTMTLQQVTIPVAGSEYMRLPVQVNDMGVVFPADTFLGGVTGLGSGVANLSIPANLSALVYFPVGNKNFSATDDPNKIVLYGPNGGIIRSKDKSVEINVDKTSGAVAITGNLTVSGTISQGTGGTLVTLGQHIHPANGSPPTPGH
jgi:hypothetical protein